MLRHYNLIDGTVWVRRDNSTAGVVDTLTKQVLAETALLTLQSLMECTNLLLFRHLEGQTRNITVKVLCDRALKIVPIGHDTCWVLALVDDALELIVANDDLRHLRRKVILVPHTMHHLDRRSQAAWRHRNTRDHQVLWAAVRDIHIEKCNVLVGNIIQQHVDRASVEIDRIDALDGLTAINRDLVHHVVQHLGRRCLRVAHVVYDLQSLTNDLLNIAVVGFAPGAITDFLTLLLHFLANSLKSLWVFLCLEERQVPLSLLLRDENTTALLADRFQDGNDVLEEPNVVDGQ